MLRFLDVLGAMLVLGTCVFLVALMAFGCGSTDCPAGLKATEPGVCHFPDLPKAGSPAIVTHDGGYIDPTQISDPLIGDSGHGGRAAVVAGAGGGGSNGGHGGVGGEDNNDDAGTGGTTSTVPACGDGLLSDDEICDPMSKSHPCPTPDTCKSSGCMVAKFSGSAEACNARCDRNEITTTKDRDGCCPKGGDIGTDSDCVPKCGNGIRESGELCDGDCATSCDDGNPCTVDKMLGSPDTCDVLCVSNPVEDGTMCGDNAFCSNGQCLTGCTVGESKCAGQPGTGSCVAGSAWQVCSGGSKVCVATWVPSGSTCGPGLTCDEQHNCK